MQRELSDTNGVPCLTLVAVLVSDTERHLQLRWIPDSEGAPTFEGMREHVGSLISEMRDGALKSLSARVISRSSESAPARVAARAAVARAALSSLGFARQGDRVEFRLPLASPSLDAWLRERADRDPLQWTALAPAGEASLERAAACMGRCALGDPELGPDDDASAFLTSSLAEGPLRGSPDCVEIGTMPGSGDVSFVMAQSHPVTGWSRITYMGVTPEHRRKGLGSVVHARGLAMLRAQGATLYHGGTHTQNTPMLSLFRALGAEEFRAMESWSLAL